jgi:hypothetical protein
LFLRLTFNPPVPGQISEFDFISVLISIIIGLGVTNLLSGADRVVSTPEEIGRTDFKSLRHGDARNRLQYPAFFYGSLQANYC